MGESLDTYRDGDRLSRGSQLWQLGRIERAEIDVERCLTFWLHFDFGGFHQGFGGLVLDEWSEPARRRVGHASGADALLGVMGTMGVTQWSELTGKLAWAIRNEKYGSIVGIARPAALVNASQESGIWLVSEWRAQLFPEVSRG